MRDELGSRERRRVLRARKGRQGRLARSYIPAARRPDLQGADREVGRRQNPLVTIAYGRTEAIDGRVFPYSFPTVFSFWSEASSAVNFIAAKAGGKDKLKGLKIATVYHDSP